MLSAEELERYARHIVLHEIDAPVCWSSVLAD